MGTSDITPLMAYRVRCATFYSPFKYFLPTPNRSQWVARLSIGYDKERISKINSSIARRKLKTALFSLAYVPVHIWRFWRGKPSLRSLSPEMRESIGEWNWGLQMKFASQFLREQTYKKLKAKYGFDGTIHLVIGVASRCTPEVIAPFLKSLRNTNSWTGLFIGRRYE